MEKEKLFGKTLTELTDVANQIHMPQYGSRQIADWLYKNNVGSIDAMTNISKSTRNKLSEKYETGLYPPSCCAESVDGTKKYLFKVLGTHHVETVYIPEHNRATICISSQAGCKMGCRFCMTGKQGFQGNLTSNEILNQFRSMPEFDKLKNIVFMGMGEPLDNLNEVLKSLEILTAPWGYGLSPTRITVSTAGIEPVIDKFLNNCQCNLAVSLHSPFHEERLKMMPVEQAYPISEVIRTIRRYNWSGQRRISFEYIVFKGWNDTPKHVKELVKLLGGIRCRVNLIRFHAVPGTSLQSPSINDMERFRDSLNDKGIIATIRASRGQDIDAACGLLSTKGKDGSDDK